MTFIQLYLIPLLLTIAIETPIYLFFLKKEKRIYLLYILLLNLVTNPLMNLIINKVNNNYYLLALILGEIAVYLLEIFVYYLIDKKVIKDILVACLANTLSLVAGIAFGYIPAYYVDVACYIEIGVYSLVIIVTCLVYLLSKQRRM